jgi:hypothetical protein
MIATDSLLGAAIGQIEEDVMKKTGLVNFAAAAAMVLGTFGAAAPAMARHYHGGDYYSSYDGGYDGYRRGDYYRGGYDGYRRGDYYRGGQDGYYNGNGYRGRYYYRCRNDGAAGTIIGAIAGGLIGNSVAGRHGDRTAGTIIGGAAGAIAGRAIDKGDGRC